jgi:heptosyltransferase III
MKRILIYRLGSLGDTVLALPAFHLIRRHFPNAQITLLTNAPIHTKAAPLASVLPSSLYDKVIDYPLGLRSPIELLRLRSKLASERFEMAISLAAPRGRIKSLRDFLFFKSCGIPIVRSIPFNQRDLRCELREDGDLFEWEAQRLISRLRWLETVNLNDDEWWDLQLTTDEHHEAAKLLEENQIETPFVAMSIGSKADAKDWTEPNWLELSKHLTNRYSDLGLVLFGSADESARSQRMQSLWKGPSANLCGQTFPRISACILSRAKLFIGHDSGPLHLAAVANTPCIGIFSARNLPGQWYPRGTQHTIFYHKTPCFGCGLETCVEMKKLCILSIQVDQVLAAALRLLEQKIESIPAGGIR